MAVSSPELAVERGEPWLAGRTRLGRLERRDGLRT